jgi:hypothetical protein
MMAADYMSPFPPQAEATSAERVSALFNEQLQSKAVQAAQIRSPATPAALLALPNWGAWCDEITDTGRRTKVPYDPRTGRKASSTNPADWMSYAEAVAAIAADGTGRYRLGFVFTEEIGMVGIDLDDCVNVNGSFTWATPFVAKFAKTYHETSPSGKGIKIWALGKLPGKGKKVKNPQGTGAIEIYAIGRFFAFTGESLGPDVVLDCQEEIDALYALLLKLEKHIKDEANSSPTPTPEGPVTEGSRHHRLLGAGGSMRNAGMGYAALLTSLTAINQTECQPPKSDREVRGIVEWLMRKPPKFQLVPSDFELSRLNANGNPGSTPGSGGDGVTPSADIGSRLQSLVDQVIESKDPSRCYADEIFELAAHAEGSAAVIARRRLKVAFGSDIVLRGVPGLGTIASAPP